MPSQFPFIGEVEQFSNFYLENSTNVVPTHYLEPISCVQLTSSRTCGATRLPTRAQQTQAPIASERITVGNASDVTRNTEQKQLTTAAFPSRARLVTRVGTEIRSAAGGGGLGVNSWVGVWL